MSPCKALLVVPRFGDSFWNVRVGEERYPSIPLGLVTVAALLPASWTCRLVDRNVEALSEEDLDWADVVMTGGMLPQYSDTLAVIALAQARGRPVVVGGPDPTSSPERYSAAEFRVLGEVEAVMAEFVAAWESGARRGLFRAEPFSVDMTTSPIPRFDLLNPRHYNYFAVQFSRGCPFNCEFCDIIELYGRRPRVKAADQVLAELSALWESGYRGQVDFVDDNLIGNKKALRQLLPRLIAFQEARGYPFKFSTEASINLADDDALLEMMRRANFFWIFVGIESPDTDTLVQAQKKQNTRRSLADSVHKLYRSGMIVSAGFIVGFDSEKRSIARLMIDCIEQTAIPVCMVGLLYALPNTQLTRRLEREGRMDMTIGRQEGEAAPNDQTTQGLNFRTLRPRRDILVDQRTIVAEIYDQAAYFRRARRLGRLLHGFRPPRQTGTAPLDAQSAADATLAPPAGKPQGPRRLFHALYAAVGLGGVSMVELQIVVGSLWKVAIRDPRLFSEICRTVADCLIHNPSAFQAVVRICIFYLHMGPFARRVVAEMDRAIAWEDAHPGWQAPDAAGEPHAATSARHSESSHAGQPVG